MNEKDLAQIKSGKLVVVIFNSHRSRNRYCPADAKEMYSIMDKGRHIWLISKEQANTIRSETHIVRFPLLKYLPIETYHECWKRDDAKKEK